MATPSSGNKQELRDQASTTHLYLHLSVLGNTEDDGQKDCKSQNIGKKDLGMLYFGHNNPIWTHSDAILNSQQLPVTPLGLHES